MLSVLKLVTHNSKTVLHIICRVKQVHKLVQVQHKTCLDANGCVFKMLKLQTKPFGNCCISDKLKVAVH